MLFPHLEHPSTSIQLLPTLSLTLFPLHPCWATSWGLIFRHIHGPKTTASPWTAVQVGHCTSTPSWDERSAATADSTGCIWTVLFVRQMAVKSLVQQTRLLTITPVCQQMSVKCFEEGVSFSNWHKGAARAGRDLTAKSGGWAWAQPSSGNCPPETCILHPCRGGPSGQGSPQSRFLWKVSCFFLALASKP